MANQPPKPQKVDLHSAEHCYILDRIHGADPMLVAGPGIKISVTADGKYKIESIARGGGAAAAPTCIDL